MPHDLQVFDRSIRHQQPMFEIPLLPLARNAFDQLLHSRSVFWVSSFQDHINRSFGCRLVSKYPKGFPRPIDFSGENIPAETPRVAQFLCFGQVRFPPPQMVLPLLPFPPSFSLTHPPTPPP